MFWPSSCWRIFKVLSQNCLVHAGYAIQVIDEDDALKTISLIKQIFEADISVK